jgi:[ribosomal protein S5]-alanine N-acetyltransferase
MPRELDASALHPAKELSADWRRGLPVLQSPGARLRELQLDDASSLRTLLSVGLASRFMSRPVGSELDFRQFIQSAAQERLAGRAACFGILPEGRDKPGGLIQVRRLVAGFETAELAFALGGLFLRPDVALGSARLVIDFACSQLAVRRLEARVTVNNAWLNGLLEELGGTPEGILRKSLHAGSDALDEILWSLINEDWLPPQATMSDQCGVSLGDTSAWVEPVEATNRPEGTLSVTADWRTAAPVLDGPRLTLREVQDSDAEALCELLSRQDQPKDSFCPPPAGFEGFRRFVEWSRNRRHLGRSICFAIVPHGESSPIGILQLRSLEPTHQTAEWGISLGSAYWGRGHFSEAAHLAIDYAFGKLGVERLEARTALGNTRGNRALQKIGAVREARLRRAFLVDGVYSDDVLWSILAEDWQQGQRV